MLSVILVIYMRQILFYFHLVNPFPDVELRCRVIKKWHGLNTLIVDVIPWCLLINKTVSTIFIKDVEDEGEIEMSSGQAIAPFRFKVSNEICNMQMNLSLSKTFGLNANLLRSKT